MREELQSALAGRYEIDSVLGSGGMAIVYLARDLKHDRHVALKVMRPEISASTGSDRFLREIRVVAKLAHPHILPLYDSGEAADLLYYVMPYVEGESLRDRLDRTGPLEIEEALRLLREVGSALGYAHDHGIVHRDVKPGNILLTGGHAVVADFGIARALDEAASAGLTRTGISVGTPTYMSPEQATGERNVDARSDEYALACVLYEMLVGAPPFSGPTPQALLARHTLDPVPSMRTVRNTIPEDLERAVDRGLAKLPADRYPTVHEFVEAVTGAGPVAARSATGSALSRITTKRLALGVATMFLLSVALLVGRRMIPGLFAPAPEEQRVAVLDFESVGGLDRDMQYLTTAVPEFLTLALTGETGEAGAIDRRRVTRAWEGAKGRSNDPIARYAAVAKDLGATHVITGRIIPQPNGRVLAEAQLRRGREMVLESRPVVLPAADAIAVAESLGVQLLAASAGELERLPGLVSSSTGSVQEWLAATAAFRRGDWREASEKYAAALDEDSTFALAAWGLMISEAWREGITERYRRGRRLAWAHRDRLPPADSAVFVAESHRNNYPEVLPGGEREALEMFARTVQRFPDSWMVWIRYGDYLWHEGGMYAVDGRSRAVEGLLRAIQLDSLGNAEPWEHLRTHYVLTRDRESFLAMPEDRKGSLAPLTFAMMDPDERIDEETWARIEEDPQVPIIALMQLQAAGAGMENAERLAAILERRALQGDGNAAGVAGLFALNRGEQARATSLLQFAARPTGQCTRGVCQEPEMWIEQALFADGDSAVARRVRDSLDVALSGLDPRDFDSQDRAVRIRVRDGLRQRTWTEIWDLMHGDTTGVRATIALARAMDAAHTGDLRGNFYADFHGDLLEALLAVETGAPDAAGAVAAADSSFSRGGGASRHQRAYLLVLADLYRRTGDLEAALDRYRRDWELAGEAYVQLLPARSLGRARTAAAIGYRDEALRAYEQYLTLRSNPEPVLAGKVAEVRAEYESLRAGS